MISQISKIDLGMSTYAAFTAAFTPAAAPTDIFHIVGSSSKEVKVLKVFYSAVQTTSGIDIISIRRRNSANSGGTTVATTKTPLNSDFAAATATVEHYTANPASVGNSIGNVWMGKVDTPALATVGAGGMIGMVLDFDKIYGYPIVLHTVSDQLTICHDSAGLPAGLSVHCGVIWSEE